MAVEMRQETESIFALPADGRKISKTSPPGAADRIRVYTIFVDPGQFSQMTPVTGENASTSPSGEYTYHYYTSHEPRDATPPIFYGVPGCDYRRAGDRRIGHRENQVVSSAIWWRLCDAMPLLASERQQILVPALCCALVVDSWAADGRE
ncbi:hypothetical protein HL42_3743 [Trichophyton rubrum]|nr:hypothetical protein HL42_3743 [Trichophyton rubrum]